MERVCRKAWTLLAFFLAAPAVAGTVLLAPPPSKPADVREESYPESRFGQAPVKPDLGVDRWYAARESEDLDEGTRSVGRVPASKPVVPTPKASLSSDEAEVAPPRESLFPSIRQRVTEEASAAPSPKADLSNPIAGKKGVQEVAVIAGDLGYFPKTIFVTRDVPVRLYVTGASRNTLCIMMDAFQVRKQVRSLKIEEITFVPNYPGKYRFYCPVNGMEGTLIVKELASAGGQ